ncbi:tyrosine-type recombinase/integrase [Halopiger xanaduensis]|uniref:Integrase family protein n=1 Tax=Halopiger xanaduensis (strain DSM 18323 / JCM 14033 / SH-6) TaxID=797210 RepID=F8D4R7_HALXS|nr:site-specific integrase [Halopiger xanaduensis]AEH37536.1 integrase family protein [Halopiger xanaduensis SH-6]
MSEEEQPSPTDLAKLVSDSVEDLLHDAGVVPNLEPMTPREAVNEYFKVRDLKPKTKNKHESSLGFFVDWGENVAGISEMNFLSGSDLKDYRVWRREESSEQVDELSPKTEETEQKIVRKFIKVCGTFDAVRPGLHEHVLIPDLDDEDEVRNTVLDSETVKQILEHLRKYEYATREHVIWELFASAGPRLGGIRSLDVDDYERGDSGPYLKLRHRPDTETTLKNGKDGERNVFISESLAEVLDDYIKDQREDSEDKFGREPLLSSKQGRLAESTIRNYVYAWTRPCVLGRGCPYGKDPDECKAAQRNNWASQCPGSLSPHPIRKGYITQELNSGVLMEHLSDRCDVSEKILEKHYDKRTEAEKMATRKEAMQALTRLEPGYGEK